MRKRIRLWTILSLTILCISPACNISRQVTKEDLQSQDRDIYLVSVQLKDKTILDFSSDPLGYAILRDSMIYREKRQGGMEIISIDEVDLSTAQRLSTGTEDTANIVLITLGGIVIGLFLLRLIEFPSF